VDTVNPTHNQPTTAGADTPAQVLRDAALYLERHGWTQGDYYALIDSPTRPACALGAICVAVRGTCLGALRASADTPEQRTAIRATADFLAHWLADHDDKSPNCELGDDDAILDLVVSDWNDDADRTKADVITTLRRAADDWDHHQGGAK
jgi:hypothetical protein